VGDTEDNLSHGIYALWFGLVFYVSDVFKASDCEVSAHNQMPRTHQIHTKQPTTISLRTTQSQNIYEYGTPTETITLLKPVKPDAMLIPYEQLFIQAYHQTGNLVPKQNSNETHPLFQLIIDRMPPQP
jgi:hypothetical protein